MALASIRPPAVAGQFYPQDERVLRTQLAEMLSTAVALEAAPQPKAIIVPHAGYIYSGPVAANAYAQLAPLRQSIHRVVMLGPTHRVPIRGFALPAAQTFATPLGACNRDVAEWRREGLRRHSATSRLHAPTGWPCRRGTTSSSTIARTPSSIASRFSCPSCR